MNDEAVSPDAGSPRWLCWLFTSAADRERIGALFAIEREVMLTARPGLDHAVAHARMDWWQEELERLAAGLPSHPLAQTLQRASRAASLPSPNLLGLLDAARFDLAHVIAADRAELDARFEGWADSIFRALAVRATTASATFARETGMALAELEALCAIDRDARLGRLRLPLDLVELAGSRPEALASPPYAAPLAAALRDRHRALRAALARTCAALDTRARYELRGALAWTAIVLRSSTLAERHLPDVRRPGRLDGVATTWTAWRAARRARLPS